MFRILSVMTAALLLCAGCGDDDKAVNNGDAAITFVRAIGGTESESGASVVVTEDGGYMVAGLTTERGDFAIYLIRLDSLGDTLWTKTHNRGNQDMAYSIDRTQDGGYVITGSTNVYAENGIDVLLMKTDSEGDTLWTKSYGCCGRGYEVRTLDDGGFLIAAMRWSSFPLVNHFYLIRTDSNGDSLWTFSYVGPTRSLSEGVALTDDGGCIAVGSIATSFNVNDIFAVRVGADGDTVWTRAYAGAGNETGHSITATTDGNFVLGGRGGRGFYLIKIDAEGDTLWTRDFDGGASCSAVAATSDGGVLAAGRTTHIGSSRYDALVLKVNAAGTKIWSGTVGGTSYDQASSVVPTVDGGCFLVGSTYSYGAGNGDVLVAKLNVTWTPVAGR